jgi:hypothetical protein
MPVVNALEAEIEARLRDLGLRVSRTRTHDLSVELPTAGGPSLSLVEIRTSDHPVSLDRLMTHVHPRADVILGQRHIPSGLGRRYRAAGVNYVDSGGNAWISAPGFLVQIEGRKPTVAPSPGSERTSRAQRPSGLRVVFALLVRPELTGAPLRTLAEAAQVSLGAAQGVVTDLTSQGFIFTSGGERLLNDVPRIAAMWVSRYPTDLRPKLQEIHLHGPEPRWWQEHAGWSDWDAALGGEAALATLGYPIRPSTATIYGQQPWHAVRRAARLAAGEPANVTLRQRFWDPAHLSTGPLVPSLLVYADALASDDGRQIETAREMRQEDAEIRRLFAGS